MEEGDSLVIDEKGGSTEQNFGRDRPLTDNPSGRRPLLEAA
jgi:hypothetical protein